MMAMLFSSGARFYEIFPETLRSESVLATASNAQTSGCSVRPYVM
jgi:hypothetical protein